VAKKDSLAELLGGFRAGAKIEKHDASEPGNAGETAAAAEISLAKKAPGILDPIMAQLTPEEKFQVLSGLMDFMGDFIINMLDQYTFELGKVESSISNLQSTVLNQVRTIRNQVDIARQQGHFKALEGPPVPPGLAGTLQGSMIAAAAAAVGSGEEPRKRREATERDVMDIAASIRTLITRQKMAKPAATQPAAEEAAIKAEPAQEAMGKASLDSKLQQFQKSADEQKQRIDRIASTAKPTTARATQVATRQPEKGPAIAKPEKPARPASRKKQGKPAAPAAKPGSTPGVKPAASIATKPAGILKLDKEKDMLPKGFQQELMKNIKDLMKDKEKDAKKRDAK